MAPKKKSTTHNNATSNNTNNITNNIKKSQTQQTQQTQARLQQTQQTQAKLQQTQQTQARLQQTAVNATQTIDVKPTGMQVQYNNNNNNTTAERKSIALNQYSALMNFFAFVTKNNTHVEFTNGIMGCVANTTYLMIPLLEAGHISISKEFLAYVVQLKAIIEPLLLVANTNNTNTNNKNNNKNNNTSPWHRALVPPYATFADVYLAITVVQNDQIADQGSIHGHSKVVRNLSKRFASIFADAGKK
jgi:hypothetical protein